MDATVQLLDAATGARRHVFRGSAFCNNVAFAPNGETLVAVCEAPNPTLRFWDLRTKAQRVSTGHTDQILGLAFHPGGRQVATASWDGSVRLWDAASGREGPAFDFRWAGGHGVNCVAFTPEGRHLAVGLDNGGVAILRARAMPPEYAPTTSVTKLPTPAALADRPAAADALKREDVPEELLTSAGGGEPDKAPPELVAVFGEDRHTGKNRICQVFSVAISPDGKLLAYGGMDKVVRLIDLATGKLRHELNCEHQRGPQEGYIYFLAFSPDGKTLAGLSRNGAVFLWDTANALPPRSLPNSDKRSAHLAFSPDGALVATAGYDGKATVRLWDVATGRSSSTFSSPATDAWCVAFSPDGKTVAAGLDWGEVGLWDVASGWKMASLEIGGRPRWLGFHPDGRSLVVAGNGLPSNAVQVWDLATRRPARLVGHDGEAISGAWRADGRLLVTAGSLDGTVRLWDVGGDRPRSRALAGGVRKNVNWLCGIALSPEGRHLAVCNPNGTVNLLRLAKRGEVCGVPAEGPK